MDSPRLKPRNRSNLTTYLHAVLAILFGILVLFSHSQDISALLSLFVFFALFTGLLEIIGGLRQKMQIKRWWVLLIPGAVNLFVGIFTVWLLEFSAAGQGVIIIFPIIGIWAAVIGALQIIIALKVPHPLTGHPLMAIPGSLYIVAGILFFVSFPSMAISIVWPLGVCPIVFGVFLLIFSQFISRKDLLSPS